MAPIDQNIQDSLQVVSQFRRQHASNPALAQASAEVKRFQARRFQATYADLLQIPRYKAAATFFLHELYSDKDYAERDQQFARIVKTISRLFPQEVVNTTAALAELHALTETLDDQMATCWLADSVKIPEGSEFDQYIRCWRRLANREARHRQLDVVLQLGQEMDRLTRMRGLQTLLKMMRRPAAAAGLDALQKFLETGFAAFAKMDGADAFLKLIQQRESEWIKSLFDDDAVSCRNKLAHLLAI